MTDKDKWTDSGQGQDGEKQRTAIGWERDLVERLASASLKEQRRARRWGIFFKVLLFAYLFALLIVYMPDTWTDKGIASTQAHTGLVKVTGLIAEDTEASAANVMASLQDAFEDKKTKGVIVAINSPGGSAVQAGQIHDEILRLREKYPDTPVYAVIDDLCASGGYYIAAAAEKIYGDKASLVGSIGVVMGSFGFVDALDKLGLERRLITAGEHKGFMDPFSPVRTEELQHLRSILDNIHQQFIDVVKEGRGDRLQEDENMFSGLIWTGEQALDLGLIDGLGSSSYVARELIGAKKIINYTTEKDLLERLADRLGAGVARTLVRLNGMDAPSLLGVN